MNNCAEQKGKRKSFGKDERTLEIMCWGILGVNVLEWGANLELSLGAHYSSSVTLWRDITLWKDSQNASNSHQKRTELVWQQQGCNGMPFLRLKKTYINIFYKTTENNIEKRLNVKDIQKLRPAISTERCLVLIKHSFITLGSSISAVEFLILVGQIPGLF